MRSESADDDEEAMPQVLSAVTYALERMVARNDRISPPQPAAANNFEDNSKYGDSKRKKGVGAFAAPRAPSISVGKYLERIYRYARCSPACFVVGFVYLDRLAHRYPAEVLVRSINAHRLVLTSVLIASKFLDDTHHDNAFYAKVGGVSNSELNLLELELLFLLDFRLMVSSQVFRTYCIFLEKEMMLNANKQKIEITIAKQLDQVEADILRENEKWIKPSSSPPIYRKM